MELPFAAVQQLCAPFFELLARLPQPQREALGVAFGLSSGSRPPGAESVPGRTGGSRPAGRGRRGAATRSAVVDDAQWLDSASARTLAFVARRLLAEKIALVFATREPGDALAGLPELHVGPLGRRDARALLESVLPARLDERVLERIVAETRGNPLALLELPRGLTPDAARGRVWLAGRGAAVRRASRRALRGGWRGFPAMRDACCSWRRPTRSAIRRWCGGRPSGSGSPSQLRTPSNRRGCWTLSPEWCSGIHWFARPSIGAAGLKERREVHRALAEATDPEIDPDRRAWHRAQATSMPDEDVAAELERSAGRAQARGGLAAVAAFLERAAALTPEPARRAQRLLAAAGAKRDAGDLEAALGLLAGVEEGARRARARPGRVSAGPDRVGAAARRRRRPPVSERGEPPRAARPELARETYLEALGGAMASDVEVPGGAPAVAAAARPRRPAPCRHGRLTCCSTRLRSA